MNSVFTDQNIDASRRILTSLFRDKSIETPELDARLLIGAVLNLDLTGLATSAVRTIDNAEARQLWEFAQRRMQGEPVARILGIREFWGMPFRLSMDTLVPRPDTETVVETALEILRPQDSEQTLHILDIGTGSGAILLALLSELPNASGLGTDINEGALYTAAANAGHLGLNGRAAFLRCNYADALTGLFDLIISNPPYVPSQQIATLDIEVRAYDPHHALDGGADGLDAYRAIVPEAARLLKKNGTLIMEVGQHQSGAVENIMAAEGLILFPSRPDLRGIPRAVIGRK